jgi:hypothetical protein
MRRCIVIFRALKMPWLSLKKGKPMLNPLRPAKAKLQACVAVISSLAHVPV